MNLTNREKEVLEIIRKNPLISQQELADFLGIARSSVAVHITNLSKKGYIKGKGYILKEEDYVTVIGGTNIDLQGFPKENLILNDSNPGKIKVSLGGVGRNIAENLVKLGIETKLISAIGEDIYGKKILEESKLSGIDMENCLILKDYPTSTYLSILDENGDMKVAISDMDIFEKITVDFIKQKSHILKNSKIIVLDTNLPKEVIEYILFNFKGIDFFLDTVSTKKSIKVKDFIGLFNTIKPNKYEAESLSGIKINSMEDLKKCSYYFLNKGVKKVFITLGKKGVFCADEKDSKFIPNPKVNVVNTTGAGDAFISGLIYSHINNYNLEYSTKIAISASILALSHKNTINPNMSIDNIQKILKEMNLC
ncbi:PfkB family carbohydrate kinase [Tepidibacter thalassicus]|uniref:Pseudouridine kinase n=1 Tax=Tepidibacter thalassicus DSM 15285 TaxID=1123350 RepID=A0A1M5S1E4_9FIRM|nr:PfkB family carbohydrate kinase [Tepidibacter thalassicus]SHH32407.1 pseudouridine kinase [Tepidibacter thalassicus DSM 15285]